MNRKFIQFLLFTILLGSFLLQVISTYSRTNSSSDETQSPYVDSFYYSYQESSYWAGGYNLESWFFSNQNIRIKYSFFSHGMYNTSNGEGTNFFMYLHEFDSVIDGGNWSYYATLVSDVKNWNFTTYTENPMCDGGSFKEQIEMYDSDNNLLNTSIYSIDNDSCSGARFMPEDSNVLTTMSSIKEYIILLIDQNNLDVVETISSTITELTTSQSSIVSQIHATGLDSSYGIAPIIVLAIIVTIRRKNMKKN